MKMSTFSTSTHCRAMLVATSGLFDLPALGRKPGILDRHLGRHGGSGAAEIGVEPRHVGQYADLDGLILRKRAGRCGQRERAAQEKRGNWMFHVFSLNSAQNVFVVQTPR